MKSDEELVRSQIRVARKFMTREPTARDIRKMMDFSIVENVDVEALLEDTRDGE